MGIARGFILVWFLLAFGLSVSGWFEQFSSATLFGFGALASATGFAFLHWRVERFRKFTLAQSLKRQTLGQTLRFFGILALVKWHQHVLPGIFAVPTGLLDILFAATSFFVASRLVSTGGEPRRGFFLWHVMGLGALAISVTMAVLTSPTLFGTIKAGVSSQAMTWFPMSLVPTFIGPLVLVLHLLALTSAHPHYKRPE